MKRLGRHVIVEFYGCDQTALSGVADIELAMLRAAEAARATVITHNFHQFEPYGVSGVVVISESHLTIHTWPEYGFAAVDIFFCAEGNRPELAIEVLRESLKPTKVEQMVFDRGNLQRMSMGLPMGPKRLRAVPAPAPMTAEETAAMPAMAVADAARRSRRPRLRAVS